MRQCAVITAVVTAALLVAAPALAGGWAVTTVTEMPAAFEPGATHEVAFEIRAHGTRLVTDLEGVAVVLTRSDGPPETRRFLAHPSGTTWRAAVETPSVGRWTWRIEPGGYAAVPMGELITHAGAPGSTIVVPRVLLGAMLAGAGAVLFLRRGKPQPATA